jgi:uncharacterized protein
VRAAWRTRILPHLVEVDLRLRLRQTAEEGAVRVSATNLRDLLLTAPAGSRTTMGLDPSLRAGVKVAVVDATGKALATETIYPHEPRRQWEQSLAVLARLAKQHDVDLIAIGNGTTSRETDKLAAELLAHQPELGLTQVVVSEAGASVYSASACDRHAAAREYECAGHRAYAERLRGEAAVLSSCLDGREASAS